MAAGGGPRARDTRAPAGDKRGRILDAAVRVVAEKGFFGATIAEIAREAGVADGTIYLYFRSKDDLLVSLVEDALARILAEARSRVAAAPSPLEALREFVRNHLGQVACRPDLALVLTVELRPSARPLRTYFGRSFVGYLDLLAELLRRGQADGSIRPDLNVKAVRRAIFGALDEVALAWLLGGRRFALAQNAEELAGLFARGVAAPGAAAEPRTAGSRAGAAGSDGTGGEASPGGGDDGLHAD